MIGKKMIISIFVLTLLTSTVSISATANDRFAKEEDVESLDDLYMRVFPGDIINEGEIIEVFVMSQAWPVSETRVEFNGQTEITDRDGKVTFVTPDVDSDTEFLISAFKEGYKTARITISVLDIPPIQLEIESPEFANERETFDVRITAEDEPVENALVLFSSVGHAYQKFTDSSGMVSFTAPEVDSDTLFGISVDKIGDYIPATNEIVIIDVPLYLKINADSSVDEDTEFVVSVKDQSENKVSGAIVSFNDGSKVTDQNGLVSFIAPNVDKDTRFMISARKDGYIDANQKIIILNYVEPAPSQVYVDDDFNENTSGWKITHFNSIQEGVDAVKEAGAVYVANGFYDENIVIQKQLSLLGEDENHTIINADNENYLPGIQVINTDNVLICGFTIQNSLWTGLFVYNSNYITIMENILINNAAKGIAINQSNHVYLYWNTIKDSTLNGIYVEGSNDVNALYNEIESICLLGIEMRQSSGLTIKRNDIRDCHVGVDLFHDTSVVVSYNTIINCDIAINLDSCSGCSIYANHIY